VTAVLLPEIVGVMEQIRFHVWMSVDAG